MKKGDRLVIIKDVNAELTSPNTVMVSALLTLGIPLHPEHGIREFREKTAEGEKRTVLWTLRDRSLCGRHDTLKMIAAWKNAEWLKANPDHPLAYLKRAFENHRRMVEHIKTSVPLAMVRKGKRVALVPMDATPEEAAPLINRLGP